MGAISNVRVQGATQTQAVISYTAPAETACTVEAYNLDEDVMALEIASVANTTPIEVTLKNYVFAETGDKVYIYGNATANGYWTLTRDANDPKSFRLNGSAASGTSSGGRVAVLVHDLNPRLFAGADQDSRPGGVVSGRARTVVIGKRAAEPALTGWYVSRALELETQHRYHIICGSDEAGGAFRTPNAPLGNLNPEPLPADPDHPGRYQYPSIDWSHPEYPQTSTLQADNGSPCSSLGKVTFNQSVSLAVGDIIVLKSGPQKGRARSVKSVVSSNVVCVERGFSTAQPAGTAWGRRPPDVGNGVQRIIDPQTGALIRRLSAPAENFRVNTDQVPDSAQQTGSGWQLGGSSSSLVDGIAAAGDSKTVAYTGDANQDWLWIHWGGFNWFLYDDSGNGVFSVDAVMARIGGSVDVADSNLDNNSIEVCLKDPTSNTALACKGKRLTIDLTSACSSADCWAGDATPMIAAWLDPADKVGSYVNAVELFGANGGILIRKKSSFANTVTLDRVWMDFDRSEAPSSLMQTCNPFTYPQTYGGASRDGYICGLAPGTTLWHWIDPKTGDATSLGESATRAGGAVLLHGLVGSGYGLIYDTTTPNTFYTSSTKSDGSGSAIVKTSYTGQGLEYLVNSNQAQEDFTMFLNSSLVSSATLESQMEAATAATYPYRFAWYKNMTLSGSTTQINRCNISGLQDDRNLQVGCIYASQDQLGWKGIYSLDSNSIVATAFSDGAYPERGCMVHSSAGLTSSNGWTMAIGQTNQSTDNRRYCGVGPSQTELAATLESSGSYPCPELPFEHQTSGKGSGSGGSPQCSMVQVTGDYRDTDPCSFYSINSGRLISISVSGTTATASASETVSDVLSAGMTVQVAGSGAANLDGDYAVATVSSRSFTFAVSGVGEGAYTTPGMSLGRLCGTEPCETEARSATRIDPGRSLRVGDVLKIDSELVQVLAKGAECADPNAACNLTVLRGISLTSVAGHAVNTPAYEQCAAAVSAQFLGGAPVSHEMYWDYVHDPTSTSRASKVYTGAGHGTYPYRNRSARITGSCYHSPWGYCFKGFTGDMAQQSAQFMSGTSLEFADRVKFAGVGSALLGDSHMSFPLKIDEWFADAKSYYSGDPQGSWTEVESGKKLFKLTWAAKPKQGPVEFSCGNRAVVDISPGPITSADSDAYKSCVPQAAGECYAGATTGEVYLNCPDATTSGCNQAADADTLDKCVRQADFKIHAYRQVGFGQNDPFANRQRSLTNGFQKNRLSVFNGYTRWGGLPLGEWGYFVGGWLDDVRSDLMLVKLPPFGPQDSVNRGTFIPVQVQLGWVPKGTDNIVAEFGYTPDFHCTSRQEACVAAGTGQVNETTPFYWASEGHSGLSCVAGCTLTIPALPQRVVYYRIQYRQADGSVLAMGPTQVSVTP
jgi:hypothetical protein